MSGVGGEDFELPPAETLVAIHARLLELYGGAAGIRDEGAIGAALARPGNLLAYEDEAASVPRLAVALAFSIARIRHPFVDGNKRVAFAALVVTLELNGLALDVSETAAAQVVLDVAGGALTEEAFVTWVTANTVLL